MRRLVSLICLALVACSGGGDGDELVLDGSPRTPDAEGVVEKISFEKITLDGNRTYPVGEDLASFSTYDLVATPMLHRKGQYVQLGLDGDEAVWMAGIGVVVRVSGRPPVVFYNGHLLRTEDGRAIFRDGTVLRLGRGVRPPVRTGAVRAEIDPARHVVRVLVVP